MSENKTNHDADHACGCGHDHDHDHDHHVHTVTLELENGEELICPIIEIFEVDGKEYIALLHPEEEIALLYGFVEHDDESLELTEIVSDDEYALVSEAFNTLFDDEEEELEV
ncbi:MAG TPA: DUF1292 domain-containing protein [Clostridiales bacterium UBA8960]|jgi:uncharacterized protein YrzB (UPF0473 family)|nr:DUF1292 domain-containing protein [Clostridiales bacterium UBA8960]